MPGNGLRGEFRDGRASVILLSGIAGYVDMVGFVILLGVFPAHMTGEIVGLIGALSSGHQGDHPVRLLVIPTFVASLFVAAVVARLARQFGKSPRLSLLGLMGLAFATFAAANFRFPAGPGDSQTGNFPLRETSIVAAMAFQNAFMREFLTHSCPTTVMTGNLTHVAFELVDACAGWLGLGRRDEVSSRRLSAARTRLVSAALGSFMTGALFGSYAARSFGSLSIVIPLLVIGLLTVRERRSR